jgi:hypothetical protein
MGILKRHMQYIKKLVIDPFNCKSVSIFREVFDPHIYKYEVCFTDFGLVLVPDILMLPFWYDFLKSQASTHLLKSVVWPEQCSDKKDSNKKQ